MEFTTCYCPHPQCTQYGRRGGAHLVRRGADRGIPRLLCTKCKGTFSTSCYLEFRVPSFKLGYTMRGTTDPEVLTRLTQYLPTLQDIIEGYEERYAARQAARQATKAEAATQQTQHAVEAPLPSSPSELQQLRWLCPARRHPLSGMCGRPNLLLPGIPRALAQAGLHHTGGHRSGSADPPHAVPADPPGHHRRL